MTTRYVSEKAQGRLLKSIKVTYHEDPKCPLMTKNRSSSVEISESDQTQFRRFLKPCTVCTDDATTIVHPPKVNKDAPTKYPYPELVTIWHTSDGQELTSEVEALRHEMEIMREKCRKRKC